jgi:hypothetical protein
MRRRRARARAEPRGAAARGSARARAIEGRVLAAAEQRRVDLEGRRIWRRRIAGVDVVDAEARSIIHWSPYDRVGVVNADP